MNVLFLGYWGANDGLSQATINPHLEVLAAMEEVQCIIYVSIERSGDMSLNFPENNKILHYPFYSKFKNQLLSKAYDFTRIPNHVIRLVKENDIDLLMCRSSLAGGVGYLVHRKINIPFTVESFEPHADYMLELGIWSHHGISYLLQKWLEKKQKTYALQLMPLTDSYKKDLVAEGIDEKRLTVMPCSVNIAKFRFSEKKRRKTREYLHLSNNTIVGIYVGKFGGLYYDKEAFKLFKDAFDYYSNFYLILLNSQPGEVILSRCKGAGIDPKSVFHQPVSYNEVPEYLCAADFAFSLHRPSKFSSALSPIKNGEYWASGLPIVSSPNIGDDSEIIQKEYGGLIISGLKVEWEKLETERSENVQIERIASKYRSLDFSRDTYMKVLDA